MLMNLGLVALGFLFCMNLVGFIMVVLVACGRLNFDDK